MSIYSSKRKSRRTSRSQLGHLKLSVYEESSALTVHVYEARGLMRRESSPLDAYVKLYLLPDPQKLSKEKTKILKQKDPVFNQKFSFILNEKDDIDKRLFISVWSHHTAARNDMVGCMTFKVADLLGPEKSLNGWYQLLDEVKGRCEFSQVPSSISRYDTPRYNLGQPPGVRTFAVTLVRSERGYGFNVNGHSPVYVSQITRGLPADIADVRVNDRIVEVESTEVTRASADQVVDIVRKCPQMLHLILQRDAAPPPRRASSSYATNSLKRPRKPRTSSKRLLGSLSSIPSASSHPHRSSLPFSHSQMLVPEDHQHSMVARRLSAPPTGNDQGALTQPEGTFSTSRYRTPRNSIPEDHVSHQMGMAGQVISGRSSNHRKSREHLYNNQGQLGEGGNLFVPMETPPSESSSRYTESNMHSTMSQPFQAEFNPGGSMRGPPHHRHSHTQNTSTEQEDLGIFMRTASLSPRHKVGQGAHQHGAIYSADSAYSSEQDGLSVLRTDQPGFEGRSHPPVLVVSTPQEEPPVDWESLGTLGQQRQKAIQNLLTAEMTFCEELKTGIETYIEPLLAILPPTTHGKMFLGLRQLFDVTMVISSQLKTRRLPYRNESPPVLTYIESVADIYWSKLNELVERLKVTLQNSTIARHEIADSFTNTEFARLVEDSVVKDQKASIYSFVESANEYLPKLTGSMLALNYFTPLYHEDHRYLSSIVEALVGICRDKQIVQRWNRDQEVMKHLQLCVGFGTKVQPFRIMIPGRLLLQQGEMSLVERRKKRKVWFILFSDMLLITRKQGKILTSVEEPIPLEQLMIQDFHCSDPAEIQISTVDGSWTRLIRAGSVREKNDWMAKIKERASGSLTNRRRQGDKPRSGIQPHIQDALRKQSQQYQASAVASDLQTNAVLSSVSPLSSGGSGTEREEGESTTGRKHQQEGSLKRGGAKRRSLFNVGSKREKKDKSPEKDGLKSKKSLKSPIRPSRSSVQNKRTLADVGVDTLRQWETSFSSLIATSDGLELFEEFLKSEFSEENIQFWKACERFKTVPQETLRTEAKAIFDEYILQHAAKWVNIDHQTTKEIIKKMESPDRSIFSKAQQQVYLLMARDSFVRFVKSERFQCALKR